MASLKDGRLQKEVLQLKCLDKAMLIVEGRLEYTLDGSLSLTGPSQFTKAQVLGMLWSLSMNGVSIDYTNSLTETTEYLSLFSRWLMKDRHTSLLHRPGPEKNVFGTRDSRDWQIYLLQGFPGIGYEKAKAIVDYFGGLPLEWIGTLEEVPGIGKVINRRLMELLSKKTE